MKVLAPIVSASEVCLLQDAGAGELYCGLSTASHRKRWTPHFPLNARESRNASLGTWEELSELVQTASQAGIPLWLTANIPIAGGQASALWAMAEKAASLGIHGLILRDPAFALQLRQRIPELAIDVSCLGGSFNEGSLAFWSELGAERVTLPRQLSEREICILASGTSIPELAVFAASTRCFFSNAFCSTRHGVGEGDFPLLSKLSNTAERILGSSWGLGPLKPLGRVKDKMEWGLLSRKGPLCYRTYQASWPESQQKAFRFYPRDETAILACGCCSLLAFSACPSIVSAKVTSRDHPIRRRLENTRLVARSLKVIEDAKPDNPGKTLTLIKNIFTEERGQACHERYCYYRR